MHKKIYEKILGAAKAQKTINYSDIAPLAGLDMSNPDDRNQIAHILGEISTHEHATGRPLLSALVIHKEDNMPGQGFFTLALELGVYKGGDELQFFAEELKRVHSYWSKQ